MKRINLTSSHFGQKKETKKIHTQSKRFGHWSKLKIVVVICCVGKDTPVGQHHRPNNYMKIPNPKCRLYWSLIEFID